MKPRSGFVASFPLRPFALSGVAIAELRSITRAHVIAWRKDLEAVEAKPTLNFALRSCILFNNDSGLGGGG
jgi:hypothetical protein